MTLKAPWGLTSPGGGQERKNDLRLLSTASVTLSNSPPRIYTEHICVSFCMEANPHHLKEKKNLCTTNEKKHRNITQRSFFDEN